MGHTRGGPTSSPSAPLSPSWLWSRDLLLTKTGLWPHWTHRPSFTDRLWSVALGESQRGSKSMHLRSMLQQPSHVRVDLSGRDFSTRVPKSRLTFLRFGRSVTPFKLSAYLCATASHRFLIHSGLRPRKLRVNQTKQNLKKKQTIGKHQPKKKVLLLSPDDIISHSVKFPSNNIPWTLSPSSHPQAPRPSRAANGCSLQASTMPHSPPFNPPHHQPSSQGPRRLLPRRISSS